MKVCPDLTSQEDSPKHACFFVKYLEFYMLDQIFFFFKQPYWGIIGTNTAHIVLFSRWVVSNSLQPHDCSVPGFPVLRDLQEFAQTSDHWISNAIQPSPPLPPPSPPALGLCQPHVYVMRLDEFGHMPTHLWNHQHNQENRFITSKYFLVSLFFTFVVITFNRRSSSQQIFKCTVQYCLEVAHIIF